MHYIKLLSVPRYKSQIVSCVFSITTDLSESFFAGNATVEVCVLSPERSPLVPPLQLEWSAKARVLKYAQQVSRISTGSVIQAKIVHHDASTDRPMGVLCEIASPHSQPHRQVGSLEIAEEIGESIAKHVWDSGILLTESVCGDYSRAPTLKIEKHIVSRYLTTQNDPSFLELGTGCGLVGLGLASRFPNAQVTLTDLADAKNIANTNIRLNNLQHRVSFRELDWQDLERSRDFATPDWIVVCDCTYNSDTYGDLLKMIRSFVDRPDRKPKVLIAHKFRNEQETEFFDQIASALETLDILEFQYMDQHYRFWVCGSKAQ